jgi:hypothetical protein
MNEEASKHSKAKETKKKKETNKPTACNIL